MVVNGGEWVKRWNRKIAGFDLLIIFLEEKNIMDCIQLINQNIISKDQSTSLIYKLSQGTAKIINQHQQTVKTIQAPCYLNIIQCLYSVPTLKTVQAVGRCQIKKIAFKEQHKLFIKQLKEKGVRKSKFKLFDEIHSSKFYQLARLGVLMQFRKGEQYESKNQCFYFVVSGSIIAAEKESSLKMLRLEEGSIWCGGQSNTVFTAEIDQTKFIEVECNIVYCILHEKQKELIQLVNFQTQTLQNFKQRNERVDRQIKRSKQKHLTKQVISKNFANSIQFRYKKPNNLNKWMRAKTCCLKENGEIKKTAELIEEIKKENTAKFMELMEINKKKLRKNQFFCKSIEKLYSLSCTATPESTTASSKLSIDRLSNTRSHKHHENSININVNYNRTQFAQAVTQILKKKPKGNLMKMTYSRNKGKIGFPQRRSRQNTSESSVRLKIT